MSELHSINEAQRLYVQKCGGGFTCLGFDVCERWLAGYLSHLAAHGQPLPYSGAAADIGTPERFAQYNAAVDAVRAHNAATGIKCETQLSPQLTGREGYRVEVIDGPGDKPRRFIVGKSTGWIPIHLEIERRNSSGGGGASHKYHSVRVIEAVR